MRTVANLKFDEKVEINDNYTSNPSHRRILEVSSIPGEETELITGSVFDNPMVFFVERNISCDFGRNKLSKIMVLTG